MTSFSYSVNDNDLDDDDKLNLSMLNNDDELDKTVKSLTETMITLMDESTSFTFILKKVIEAIDVLSLTGTLKKKCAIQTLKAIYCSKDEPLPIQYDILDRFIDLVINASKGRLRINKGVNTPNHSQISTNAKGFIKAKNKSKKWYCFF